MPFSWGPSEPLWVLSCWKQDQGPVLNICNFLKSLLCSRIYNCAKAMLDLEPEVAPVPLCCFYLIFLYHAQQLGQRQLWCSHVSNIQVRSV